MSCVFTYKSLGLLALSPGWHQLFTGTADLWVWHRRRGPFRPRAAPGPRATGMRSATEGARRARGSEEAPPGQRHSSLTEHPEVHVGGRVEGAARQQHHAMGARHRERLPCTARDAGGDDGDHRRPIDWRRHGDATPPLLTFCPCAPAPHLVQMAALGGKPSLAAPRGFSRPEKYHNSFTKGVTRCWPGLEASLNTWVRAQVSQPPGAPPVTSSLGNRCVSLFHVIFPCYK